MNDIINCSLLGYQTRYMIDTWHLKNICHLDITLVLGFFMTWHLRWWYQPRVMVSTSGTRDLKNIDISANSILTSMTTLDQQSLPLSLMAIFLPFQHFLPLWHQWQMGYPRTPSIILLHDAPHVMMLFLAMWLMIDVFTFIHVMNHLSLSAQIRLAHEALLALCDQVEGIIIISCFSSMELLTRDDLSRFSMCNSSRIS